MGSYYAGKKRRKHASQSHSSSQPTSLRKPRPNHFPFPGPRQQVKREVEFPPKLPLYRDRFKGSSPGSDIAVSHPESSLEKAADAMAEQVMEAPAADVQEGAVSHEIQRESTSGAGEGGVLDTSTAREVRTLSGQGSPLPEETRSFMESRMGADFGDVRVHTGPQAEELSRRLYAKAFTYGKNVVFNRGQYSPGSQEGKQLLAHELAHTVQQGGRSPGVQKQEIESQGVETNTPSTQFNNRDYFYLGGIKFEKRESAGGTYFEAIRNGRRITYEMTDDNRGLVLHVYYNGRNFRTANVTIDEDGKIVSFLYENGMGEMVDTLRDFSHSIQEGLARVGEVQQAEAEGMVTLYGSIFHWSTLFDRIDNYYMEAEGSVAPSHDIRYQFRNEGEGFANYASQANPGNHKWGRLETVETLRKTIIAWRSRYPGTTIYINDLSVKGGGSSPFQHHFSGISIDVKWVSTDNQVHAGDFDSPSNAPYYDRAKTIALIKAFIQNAPEGYEVQRVFFNDDLVIKYFEQKGYIASDGRRVLQEMGGHSNHLHIQIKPEMM